MRKRANEAGRRFELQMQSEFKPNTEGVWFGLPAETYHAAPGLSSSTLKQMAQAATPLHWSAVKDEKIEPNAAMQMGTVIHKAVLEPKSFKSDFYYVRPLTYCSEKGETKPWSENANACKRWTETHSDKPVITVSDEKMIPKIVKRVKALREFGYALEHGETEVSFFRKDEETGLLMKCRTDLISEMDDFGFGAEGTWIFDLKKVFVGGANHEDFAKACASFGYYLQSEYYLRVTGASRFIFVPFDDDYPCDAAQFECGTEASTLARMEIKELMKQYATGMKKKSWPGYAAGIQQIKLPRWLIYARRDKLGIDKE